MSAPELTLRTSAGQMRLGPAPCLMGIVNATPDSFSDPGARRTLEERLELAASLVEAGADIIDVGGESGVTNRPPVEPEEEIDRVAPLIERIIAEIGVPVSVDTYKPTVARAAIQAGASIINDVSGLLYTELADICADTGAALVLMHTTAPPKQRLHDRTRDDAIVDDVLSFLRRRVDLALEHGMAFEQLIVDPGPDFSKTPAQTISVLRSLDRLAELGRPVLLAVSRKDFVGALTRRAPRERLPGTLAAIAQGVDAGAHLLRVHDVPAVMDFLTVRSALTGELEPDPDLQLDDSLRWSRSP